MTACIYYYGSIKIYLTNLLCCFFILNTFTRFSHAMAFLPRALWMSCSVKCKSYCALGMVRQRTLRMVVSWNLVGYSVFRKYRLCLVCRGPVSWALNASALLPCWVLHSSGGVSGSWAPATWRSLLSNSDLVLSRTHWLKLKWVPWCCRYAQCHHRFSSASGTDL